MKKTLKVITSHSGANPNGGQYGFWELWFEQDGKHYREYYTTTDISYCRYCGRFSNDDSCCDKKHERLGNGEIDVYEKAIADGRTVIDLTLHEVIECKYNGGCIICYPCYHSDCNPMFR